MPDDAKNYLIDMDGVLMRGNTLIPGAQDFLKRLRDRGAKFLVLTNNPQYTPGDLAHRLRIAGLEIDAGNIFTSAMATARFIASQRNGATCFAVGESGLTGALHQEGLILTDHEPDYVVLGETTNYSFDTITAAIRLVARGARFIATNPDPSGPHEGGIVPACGAMAALIERATDRRPFFVGKPNPLMMRTALNYLEVHSENTIMVGDRMDTDVVAGVQSGMDTILVLSGITEARDIEKYPWQPGKIVESVAEIDV
jgi:NagD protein